MYQAFSYQHSVFRGFENLKYELSPLKPYALALGLAYSPCI